MAESSSMPGDQGLGLHGQQRGASLAAKLKWGDDKVGRSSSRVELRFNPEAIIHGVLQPLRASQVVLGRLNAHMAEQKLDLLQFSAGNVAELRIRAPQILRRQLGDTSLGCTLLHHCPADPFGDSGSPKPSRSCLDTGRFVRSTHPPLRSNHPRPF